MNTQKIEEKLDNLTKSLDILIIMELIKTGAKREEIRAILGKVDNNFLSKLNRIFTKTNEKE